MAVDSTLPNLPAASVVAATDILHGVSDPDGTPSDRKYTITQVLSLASSGGATIVAATPEGLTTASPGAFAFDTVGRTLYIKETGTGNTGWIELLTLPT